jgi:hypothetical protein
MKGARRIPDRPRLRLNAATLQGLPGLARTLNAAHLGRSEPDPYYDAPDGYRRFNPVIRGPAADKLIRKLAGPPVKPGQVRCSCCKERARRQGSMLCAWCAWLLQ